MDIDRALVFIAEKGSSLEKARIECILHASTPQSAVIQGLAALQNDDGGFPFGMKNGNLSTINETTVALWWMEELTLLASPTAGKAFAYLLATQKGDGSWDEDPRVAQYDLPSWIQLDDPRTRLYLAAYATYWLLIGGYSGLPKIRKALHFLIRNQDQSGRIYGYLHTTWIAVGVFLLAGDRYARIADLAIHALAEKPLSEWDDSQIAWALDCLSKGGLPVDHPFIEECLSELSRRQNMDGSWASQDGEAYAVGATIQFLKVLKRYSLLSTG